MLAKSPNSFTAAARKDARARLLVLLGTMTEDRKLAAECAAIIHAPICMYRASLETAVVSFEKIKGYTVSKSHSLAGGAVGSLERLERTGAAAIRDGKPKRYLWAKAWRERTLGAHWALLATGKPVPLAKGIPSPAEALPLIPAAKAYARKNTVTRTTTKIERNAAVVAVLTAYTKLSGGTLPLSRSPANPTLRFISAVEECYAALLPNGFEVRSSHSMLEKLRRMALT